MTLSPQQYQCVALLARGLSDKAIARELGVATRTVKTHLTVARARTGTHNRVQLAVLFLRGEFASPMRRVA